MGETTAERIIIKETMKTLRLGTVKLPLLQFATQGNAILGIRGSGKSYTGGVIAEQLLDNSIPFIAFDPIGIWRNLKVPGAGKGYKVVVAHPDKGDLPLTPESAPEIVRAAMKNNISLIIDLYSVKLTKADWRRIVESCVRVLLHENGDYGMRHIFIEEAAEFIPQRIGPESGKVYNVMEQLARMGGNCQLGYTLINQRSEEVNKAVLELCDCLILHRQKGRNSLTALGKWLDFANSDISTEIIASLPTLAAGDCWVWSAGESIPQRTHVQEKQSYHPDRQNASAKVVKGTTTDVSSFVQALKGDLETFIAQATADDPKTLHARIRQLEKELAEKKPAPGERVEVSIMPEHVEKLFTKSIADIHEQLRQANEASIQSAEHLKAANGNLANVTHAFGAVRDSIKMPTQQPRAIHPARTASAQRPAFTPRHQHSSPSRGAEATGSLGKCERAILTALAQYPQGRTSNQVAILTGYSVNSGGFNSSLSRLRSSELINRGAPMMITDAGLTALGRYDPLPTGDELLKQWLGKLGRCESLILSSLANTYPNGMTTEELAADTNYSANSGGFNNSLSKLRTLELITRGQPIKASDDLFE
jgi:hypothetical protein